MASYPSPTPYVLSPFNSSFYTNANNQALTLATAMEYFLLLSGGTLTGNLLTNSNITQTSGITTVNDLTINGSLSNNFTYTTDVYLNGISVNDRLSATNTVLKAFIDETENNINNISTAINSLDINLLNNTFIINQSDSNSNVAEFYNSNYPTFIITSNSNIGIGTYTPSNIYKLDINGKLNANDIYINNLSVDNKISDITISINNYYCKKTTFYFTTNTVYNYNGTTYYTYNIQLNKFIRLLELNENIKLYKFRIHTSRFDSTFNNENIQESDYLIMMSNRTSVNEYSGINVRAIGLPEDLYLQNIQPWKVVKSNSFGIITYISPNQNESILCTIIDEA